MRLGDQRQSSNVEDRRGGGGFGIPIIGGGIGTIVLVVLALIFGIDPRALFQGGQPAQTQVSTDSAQAGQEAMDPAREFVSKVLASTEDVWADQFPKAFNRPYEAPKLVLFSGYTQSACGTAQSAVGPFYCPSDHNVYIDLSFYEDLRSRFGAPGDFAQAYVIAHEVGHHVQELTGIGEQVRQAEERAGKAGANRLSVRLELQADCLAGVWGFHAQQMKNILEPGDLDEALRAAAAIGDDRLQMESKGYVSPESFTHGSSEQRTLWFKRGFESGDVAQCDTFKNSE